MQVTVAIEKTVSETEKTNRDSYQRRSDGREAAPHLIGKAGNERLYSFLWGVVTVAAIIICILAGMYSKRYLNREFIGEQTRAIEQCRQNPRSSPQLCERLSKARGEVERSNYTSTLRGPQQPPYYFSDHNADLTPAFN